MAVTEQNTRTIQILTRTFERCIMMHTGHEHRLEEILHTEHMATLIQVLSNNRFAWNRKRTGMKHILTFLVGEIPVIDTSWVLSMEWVRSSTICSLLETILLHFCVHVPLRFPRGQNTRTLFLRWINDKLGHDSVVHNFREDWIDGKKLGALVNRLSPDLCRDWIDWDPENMAGNIQIAMDTMEKHFINVKRILEPADMCHPDTPDICIILVLAQLILPIPDCARPIPQRPPCPLPSSVQTAAPVSLPLEFYEQVSGHRADMTTNTDGDAGNRRTKYWTIPGRRKPPMPPPPRRLSRSPPPQLTLPPAWQLTPPLAPDSVPEVPERRYRLDSYTPLDGQEDGIRYEDLPQLEDVETKMHPAEVTSSSEENEGVVSDLQNLEQSDSLSESLHTIQHQRSRADSDDDIGNCYDDTGSTATEVADGSRPINGCSDEGDKMQTNAAGTAEGKTSNEEHAEEIVGLAGALPRLEDMKRSVIQPLLKSDICVEHIMNIETGGFTDITKVRCMSQSPMRVNVAHTISLQDGAKTEDELVRFLMACYIAVNLKHPNLLSVEAIVEQDGILYSIMPPMHDSVQRHLAKCRKTYVQKYLLWLVLQAARGVEYIHEMGYVLQRMTPTTTLVDKNYTLKIADFSHIMTVESRKSECSDNEKYPWMPPEKFDQNKHLAESDIWMMGVYMWSVMTYGQELVQDLSQSHAIYADLKEGKRLPQPEGCTGNDYNLMQDSWKMHISRRPDITEFVQRLEILHRNSDYSQGYQYEYIISNIESKSDQPALPPEDGRIVSPDEVPMKQNKQLEIGNRSNENHSLPHEISVNKVAPDGLDSHVHKPIPMRYHLANLPTPDTPLMIDGKPVLPERPPRAPKPATPKPQDSADPPEANSLPRSRTDKARPPRPSYMN